MSRLLPQQTETPPASPVILQLLDQVEKLELDVILASDPQSESKLPLEASLIRQGVVSEQQIAACYANHYLLRLFEPPVDKRLPIDPDVGHLLEKDDCIKNVVAPLTDDGRTIEVALLAPDSFRLSDTIREKTGRQMRALFAPLSVILRVQRELYQGECSEDHWHPVASDSLTGQDSNIDESRTETNYSSTSRNEIEERSERYIHRVFRAAIRHGADRIHIERYENACRVRFFARGKIVEITPPESDLASGVVSKLKLLGKMDVREMALPQDGTITLSSEDGRFIAKVSICPTIFGENVMMTISGI